MIEITTRTYAAPWTEEDRAILHYVPEIEQDKRDAEIMFVLTASHSPAPDKPLLRSRQTD